MACICAGLGVREPRRTSSEPLLRPNVDDLIGDLTAINGVEDVAYTTDDIVVAQHAADIKANRLRGVTVTCWAQRYFDS